MDAVLMIKAANGKAFARIWTCVWARFFVLAPKFHVRF